MLACQKFSNGKITRYFRFVYVFGVNLNLRCRKRIRALSRGTEEPQHPTNPFPMMKSPSISLCPLQKPPIFSVIALFFLSFSFSFFTAEFCGFLPVSLWNLIWGTSIFARLCFLLADFCGFFFCDCAYILYLSWCVLSIRCVFFLAIAGFFVLCENLLECWHGYH